MTDPSNITHETACNFPWTNNAGKTLTLAQMDPEHLDNLEAYAQRRLAQAQAADDDFRTWLIDDKIQPGFSGLEDSIAILEDVLAHIAAFRRGAETHS